MVAHKSCYCLRNKYSSTTILVLKYQVKQISWHGWWCPASLPYQTINNHGKRFVVCHDGVFLPPECWEMIDMANIYFGVINNFSSTVIKKPDRIVDIDVPCLCLKVISESITDSSFQLCHRRYQSFLGWYMLSSYIFVIVQREYSLLKKRTIRHELPLICCR